MTSLQSRIGWGLVAATVAAITLAPVPPEPEQKKQPHELLGANTVAYFSQDGSLEHNDAWKKTAAYKATHESGLMDVFEKLIAYAKEMVPPGGPEMGQLEQSFQHIVEHGVSGGISMNEAGMPAATLVVHDAADMVQPLVDLVNGAGAPLRFEEKEIAGRNVFVTTIPGRPGYRCRTDVRWWAHGSGRWGRGIIRPRRAREWRSAEPVYEQSVEEVQHR